MLSGGSKDEHTSHTPKHDKHPLFGSLFHRHKDKGGEDLSLEQQQLHGIIDSIQNMHKIMFPDASLSDEDHTLEHIQLKLTEISDAIAAQKGIKEAAPKHEDFFTRLATTMHANLSPKTRSLIDIDKFTEIFVGAGKGHLVSTGKGDVVDAALLASHTQKQESSDEKLSHEEHKEHKSFFKNIADTMHRNILPATRAFIDVANFSEILVAAGIDHFVPGQIGKNIENIMSTTLIIATAAAHKAAIEAEAQNFYNSRETQKTKHPDVENWARWINERVSSSIEWINVLTQRIATGSISLHQIFSIAQTAIAIVGICGMPIPAQTYMSVSGMAAAHALSGGNASNLTAAAVGNIVFDELDVGVIRPTIYYATDWVEWTFDKIGWVAKTATTEPQKEKAL